MNNNISEEELLKIANSSDALKKRSEHTGTFAYPEHWNDKVPLKVRMKKTVHSEAMFVNRDMKAEYSNEYFVTVNSYGAVTAILPDGRLLGLKPDEFEVIEWHK